MSQVANSRYRQNCGLGLAAGTRQVMAILGIALIVVITYAALNEYFGIG